MKIRLATVVTGCVLTVVLTASVGPVAGQSSTIVKDADGKPVQWSDWIGSRAPAAILMFSSWVPEAQQTVDRLVELQRACAARDLDLVVVDVQEPFAAARAALTGPHGVPWMHDRHGATLKVYRVIKVPALVIVGDDGQVVDRIEATPQAMASWDPDSEEE